MEYRTFDSLLASGREQLERFRQDDTTDTATGVEESLSGHFMDEMIEMNDNIYTVASTNNPGALPFFQPFFIEGVCRLSLARKLKRYLTPKYCWVVYQNPLTGEYYDRSDEIELWDMPRLGSPYDRNSPYLLADLLVDSSSLGEEVLDYVDRELFMADKPDPLVGIFIEDSCACRKDLYRNIIHSF